VVLSHNQGCGAGPPKLGILAGDGAQIKNQEPELELSLKFGLEMERAMAIWEVAPALGPFLYTNNFVKLTEN